MINWFDSIKRWLATSSSRQKLTAALLVFSLLSTFALFMMNGSSNTTNNPLDSTPFYFLGVFVKLFGVLLLIVLCAVLLRRWMQPGVGGKKVRQLHLVETVRLSPKQAIHLVSVGDQQLLIGATDQNVSLLASVDVELNTADVPTADKQPAMDFGSMLQMFSSKAPDQPS